MEPLAPAQPAPSTEELIDTCSKAITDVMRSELSDESDPDRLWILRQIHKNDLYYRDLQYYAPALYQSLIDVTGISGSIAPDESGSGQYDYSQNIYRGYCRKLEAVLGNRMPNAIAVPDNPDDEEAVRAARAANAAAEYIREKCDLQQQSLYLVFGHFNSGTQFWHVDFVFDEEKYGMKTIPDPQAQAATLGNAFFNCPQCATAHPADGDNPTPPGQCENCGGPLDQSSFQPPTQVQVPNNAVKQVPRGALEISLHNGSEISVPLDGTCVESGTEWLRYSREKHKGKLLKKWGDKVREEAFQKSPSVGEDIISEQYAENIRSAMASPIGLVRQKRANRWTECDTWWTPAMYEMVTEKPVRDLLQKNFPSGLRITSVRGIVVDLNEEALPSRWQECKPEPSNRIMADPLGNDWIETQDLLTNILNQCNETIERSNQPMFGDPTRIDFDAYQNRHTMPAEMFPALPPAGRSLADIIYQPPPVTFSEQIPPFQQAIEERTKNISGLLDPIWGGGDAEEPTARQAELKKNAALMQLGVQWTMIGKSLEKLYTKACKLLAEFEDGILSFSKKNQFGQYQTMAVVMDDLKNGKYHFESDEAIPMTWGQQRDLLMWMLDKPAELLTKWGMDDPLNIAGFKRLLGMPGMRTPLDDDREKAMGVIAQLAEGKPQPGQVDPQTGQPGPQQPSTAPDWEDDPAFCAALAKAYLIANPAIKKDNPDGYQNIVLWGQAYEQKANAPQAPPPAKASIALSLKGQDLGDPAVQDALQKSNLIDQGTQVQAVPPPMKNGIMPPPATPPQAGPPMPTQ